MMAVFPRVRFPAVMFPTAVYPTAVYPMEAWQMAVRPARRSGPGPRAAAD
jgi:hypothetical protein